MMQCALTYSVNQQIQGYYQHYLAGSNGDWYTSVPRGDVFFARLDVKFVFRVLTIWLDYTKLFHQIVLGSPFEGPVTSK